MTKIIITDNKVIFDGHSNTKEECENTTLLCNALKNSTDYKTIKYESGYAEFEKIGIAKELKFLRSPLSIDLYDSISGDRVLGISSDVEITLSFSGNIATFTTINSGSMHIDYSNDIYVETYDTSTGSSSTPLTATFKNNIENITLQDNDEFPKKYNISFITTNKVSIDLTTLTGWDNVSSGEHQISVIAKATGYRDSEKSTAVTFTKASASTGETWVLNDEPKFSPLTSTKTFYVNFTSNNTTFESIRFESEKVPMHDDAVSISYGDRYTGISAYYSGAWRADTAYKTITFDEPVTDSELLSWLQANGTKQGGTTAHTLTWSDSTMAVTVNGNAVTSPYTLANGDKIVLTRTSKPSYNAIITAGTDTYDTDVTSPPITINNSDIIIEIGTTSPSPGLYGGFTINYTE